MDISIVVPIYNIDRYLEDGLESIRKQSFINFEVILVNDGSTDSSGLICDSFVSKDSRFKVIHKENEGSGPTRNCGIDNANGTYIVFFDADDFLHTDYLKILFNEISTNNYDLVICNWNSFYNIGDIQRNPIVDGYRVLINEKEVRSEFTWLLNHHLLNAPWNKIYKRSLIEQNNVRFTTHKRAQDAFFNIKYFEYISTLKVLDVELYNYRLNSTYIKWLKFPKDYFETALELNIAYRQSLQEWGMLNKENLEIISNFFVNECIQCYIYCFSPNWNYNFKQKISYINYITNHEYTKDCLMYNKPEDIRVKIITLFMKAKQSLLITLLFNIGVFAKFKIKNKGV